MKERGSTTLDTHTKSSTTSEDQLSTVVLENNTTAAAPLQQLTVRPVDYHSPSIDGYRQSDFTVTLRSIDYRSPGQDQSSSVIQQRACLLPYSGQDQWTSVTLSRISLTTVTQPGSSSYTVAATVIERSADDPPIVYEEETKAESGADYCSLLV